MNNVDRSDKFIAEGRSLVTDSRRYFAASFDRPFEVVAEATYDASTDELVPLVNPIQKLACDLRDRADSAARTAVAYRTERKAAVIGTSPYYRALQQEEFHTGEQAGYVAALLLIRDAFGITA